MRGVPRVVPDIGRRYVRLLVTFVLATVCQELPADTPTSVENTADALLLPSGEGLPFDGSRYQDFADYVRQTRDRLERHKVYLDSNRKEIELAAAIPFELRPANDCDLGENDLPERGIVLLHGLTDMPLAMRDLAKAFAARCFLVRVMLLPGHGTRPGDLLDVTGEDWLAAARFGVETLKRDADTVFVGGFSLGGLLALHTRLDDNAVRGVYLFSPALALIDDIMVGQTVWIRHFRRWLDRDPGDDYARYEAMTMNAPAETFLLGRKLRKALQKRSVQAPIFMVLSADDAIIDPVAARKFFMTRFTHPGSRLLVYRRDPREGPDLEDHRIHNANSFLPEQRIAGFSHLSVHVAPDNAYYGANGEYRSCGQNADASPEAVARCFAVPNPWSGETFGPRPSQAPEGEPLARLTYNPRFDEMFDQIDEFIAENGF